MNRYEYYEGTVIWLALNKDEAVGIMVARKDNEGINYSPYAFYVMPAWRRLGIGTDLFRRLTELTDSEGCGLELCVLNHNGPAKRLYKLFGLRSYARLMYRENRRKT
ncbi:MAG: GNAT family N-acetyltransferase [Deltaproteobacteria bacterium]|nr:GNAT family N-acetyltransferase [Deltaproteobacteria bacterium]